MATSPFEGIVLHDASKFNGGLDPVGAALSRDVVLNNLCHYADSHSAQVRVAWTHSTINTELNPPRTRESSVSANRWYLIQEFGPFPIALRSRDDAGEGAASYRLRVRIAGKTTTSTHAVKFRAVLSPPQQGSSYVSVDEDNVFETATTTSTTAAWLTGASKGDAASTTMIFVPEAFVDSWMAPVDTLTAVGGDGVAVSQCLVSLSIFGSTANVTGLPELHGCYAAEWIGPDP